MSGTQAHHAGGTRARIGRAATGVVSSAAQFGSDRADIADSMGHTAAEMAGRAGMYGMSSTMHGVDWTAGKARRIMNRGKRALRSGKGMRKTAGKPKALSEAKPSEKIGKFAAKGKASKRIGKHIGTGIGKAGRSVKRMGSTGMGWMDEAGARLTAADDFASKLGSTTRDLSFKAARAGVKGVNSSAKFIWRHRRAPVKVARDVQATGQAAVRAARAAANFVRMAASRVIAGAASISLPILPVIAAMLAVLGVLLAVMGAFLGSSASESTVSGVPAEYEADVIRAGSICQVVTPSRHLEPARRDLEPGQLHVRSRLAGRNGQEVRETDRRHVGADPRGVQRWPGQRAQIRHGAALRGNHQLCAADQGTRSDQIHRNGDRRGWHGRLPRTETDGLRRHRVHGRHHAGHEIPMGAVHLVGRDQKSRHRKTDTRVGQRRHMGRFRGVGRLHGGRLPIRRQRHRVPTGSIGRVRRLRACRHGRGGPRGRVDPDQRVQRAWPRRRIHTRNQRLPTGRSRKWRPLHPLKGKPSMEPKRNRIIAATGFAVALLILGGNVAVICAGNGTAEDTQSTVARPRTKTEPGQKTAGDEETEPATPTEDDPCADLAPKALGVYMGDERGQLEGEYFTPDAAGLDIPASSIAPQPLPETEFTGFPVSMGRRVATCAVSTGLEASWVLDYTLTDDGWRCAAVKGPLEGGYRGHEGKPEEQK